jgi:hypothetical protein
MRKDEKLEATLEAIDLESLEKATGGQQRGRWQTAQGREEIGNEFEECMTSANRGWVSKTWDWAVAGVTGGYSDQRTQRDCTDAYKKEMDIPR